MSDPVVPGLAHAFDVEVQLARPEEVGPTRAGRRRIVPIVGGTVRGGIEGEILPGGADWQLLRDDGAVEIDCRYSARTASGAIVYLQVSGVRSGPPEVLEALLRGDPVPPKAYYFRTAIRLETAAPELAHLQEAIYVASCIRDADRVRFAAYRLT